jgi:hypothetical protein
MTAAVLGVIAVVFLVLYLMRRRARLRSEEDSSNF